MNARGVSPAPDSLVGLVSDARPARMPLVENHVHLAIRKVQCRHMLSDSATTGRPAFQKESLIEWLLCGTLLTITYLAIPSWALQLTWKLFPKDMRTEACARWYWELLSLGFALLLTLGSWRRSGLRIGNIRQHWRGTVLVCGIPIALTAIIYPLLPERPFSDQGIQMWLTSPWHQDMVFAGFLYGRFAQVTPSYIHSKIRIRWALVLAAVFFALHHLPNLLSISAGYVAFQLAYTFLGMLLVGLARQWTGSILYGAITHMAVNCIAWATS